MAMSHITLIDLIDEFSLVRQAFKTLECIASESKTSQAKTYVIQFLFVLIQYLDVVIDLFIECMSKEKGD